MRAFSFTIVQLRRENRWLKVFLRVQGETREFGEFRALHSYIHRWTLILIPERTFRAPAPSVVPQGSPSRSNVKTTRGMQAGHVRGTWCIAQRPTEHVSAATCSLASFSFLLIVFYFFVFAVFPSRSRKIRRHRWQIRFPENWQLIATGEIERRVFVPLREEMRNSVTCTQLAADVIRRFRDYVRLSRKQ